MIVFNWPKECPECGSTALAITTLQAHSSIIEVKVPKQKILPTGEVMCDCTNKHCEQKPWKIELATTDPVMYVKDDKVMALANPQIDEESGRELLSIDRSWSFYKLSTILDRCAARVTKTVLMSEETAREEYNATQE